MLPICIHLKKFLNKFISFSADTCHGVCIVKHVNRYTHLCLHQVTNVAIFIVLKFQSL